MNLITRLRRDRVAAVLDLNENNERLLREATDQDLMAVALATCERCTFWDNAADRAGFVPCALHAPLFAERNRVTGSAAS